MRWRRWECGESDDFQWVTGACDAFDDARCAVRDVDGMRRLGLAPTGGLVDDDDDDKEEAKEPRAFDF